MVSIRNQIEDENVIVVGGQLPWLQNYVDHRNMALFTRTSRAALLWRIIKHCLTAYLFFGRPYRDIENESEYFLLKPSIGVIKN